MPDLPTLLQRLDQANQLRATHPTCSSPDSSRSHAFCILHLTDPTSSAPQCCLRIVDLAGSERRNDVYGHSPERVAETKAINWSLGCLKVLSHVFVRVVQYAVLAVCHGVVCFVNAECRAVLKCVMLCCAMPCHAVLCCAVLCCAVL